MANNPQVMAKVLKLIKGSKGFERVIEKVKLISIGNGSCHAEYEVEEEMSNIVGTMHGGFSATLVDTISSYALFSDERSAVPSVSVDMHLTYLKAAPIGDVITIDAKTLRSGKTLAYLSCEIRNKKTGDLLVNGLHTKYLMRS